MASDPRCTDCHGTGMKASGNIDGLVPCDCQGKNPVPSQFRVGQRVIYAFSYRGCAQLRRGTIYGFGKTCLLVTEDGTGRKREVPNDAEHVELEPANAMPTNTEQTNQDLCALAAECEKRAAAGEKASDFASLLKMNTGHSPGWAYIRVPISKEEELTVIDGRMTARALPFFLVELLRRATAPLHAATAQDLTRLDQAKAAERFTGLITRRVWQGTPITSTIYTAPSKNVDS